MLKNSEAKQSVNRNNKRYKTASKSILCRYATVAYVHVRQFSSHVQEGTGLL